MTFLSHTVHYDTGGEIEVVYIKRSRVIRYNVDGYFLLTNVFNMLWNLMDMDFMDILTVTPG